VIRCGRPVNILTHGCPGLSLKTGAFVFLGIPVQSRGKGVLVDAGLFSLERRRNSPLAVLRKTNLHYLLGRMSK